MKPYPLLKPVTPPPLAHPILPPNQFLSKSDFNAFTGNLSYIKIIH